jgi:hypothetical protein
MNMSKRVIEQVLELARWAPSGDNTQPWRFRVVSEYHFVVHGFDTREWCLYDIDGRPSQLALGALLENIDIALSEHGLTASITRRMNEPETRPTFDVRLQPAPGIDSDPLRHFIAKRSVQRRALRTRYLAPSMKSALEAAVGADHHVRWFEGFWNRFRVEALMFRTSGIRLRMPEAYSVHRDVIAWNSRFSEAKVPDAAIGLDPVTTRLMRWVMQDWRRVRFFNRFLAGTWSPRMQMDLVPGVACAAHFAIVAARAPADVDDYIAAGRAMQRFWLTATQLGLQLQPEMTPLIFAAYARKGRCLPGVARIRERAAMLAARFERLVAPDATSIVFMGRVGGGRDPVSRSLRLPLADLMLDDPSANASNRHGDPTAHADDTALSRLLQRQ